MDYELRQVYRGPEAYVMLPADAGALDARIAEALDAHPDNDELKAAVVLEAQPRKVVAVLQSGEIDVLIRDSTLIFPPWIPASCVRGWSPFSRLAAS